MKKKFLYALLLSSCFIFIQNNVKAEAPWAGEGTVTLNSDYTMTNDRIPEQTDDITIDGNKFGINGDNQYQLYRDDDRLPSSPNNPTMYSKSITLQNLGDFTLNSASQSGENTITLLDENGNKVFYDYQINNQGLHNFYWGAEDLPSNVTKISSIFSHEGDISILKTVIKDNTIEHSSKSNGGRSGGAIHWVNEVEWDFKDYENDDYDIVITDDTGENGFKLQDSLIINNGINSTAEDEEEIIAGGAFELEGSGFDNDANTVLIDKSYFIENFINSQKSIYAQGGAIVASAIHNFTVSNSYFGKNYVKGQAAYGGAIYINNAEVYEKPYLITSTVFEDNYAKSDIRANGIAEGGAVLAYYYTDITNSLFEGNYVESPHYARGGALFLQSGDEDLEDLDENWGYNDFEFNIENTKFNNNSAKMKADKFSSAEISGGAIYNDHFATTTIKNSTFTGNEAIAYGDYDGEKYNGTAQGGAIFNYERAVLTVDTSNFTGNKAVASTEGEKGNAFGGAIYNKTDAKLTVKDSTFSENEAIGAGNSAGGAIFNAKDAELNIIAENTDVLFEKNKSGSTQDNLTSDAITDDGGKINLNAKKDRSIIFNDRILSYKDNGSEGIININQADEVQYDGTVVINNDMTGYKGTVNFEGGILQAGKDIPISEDNKVNLFTGASSFNVNNTPMIDVSKDNRYATYNLGNLNLKSDLNASIQADLRGEGKIDKFEADTVQNDNESKININYIDLVSDTDENVLSKELTVTDDSDLYGVITLGEGAKEALAPIFRYGVTYDEEGNLTFLRGDLVNKPEPEPEPDPEPQPEPNPDNPDNPHNPDNPDNPDKPDKPNIPDNPNTPAASNPTSWRAFNPAVLASTVAVQAGALATMNNTNYYAMQHAQNYMNYSKSQRFALKSVNKYAMAQGGPFSPLYTKEALNGFWFKPYATFENIPLKNGPKVSNISYGSLIGYDAEMVSHKNGWDSVFTGYIGYNGASQRYSGVDTYLNGGTLGSTFTLYKGNFYNATNISVGSILGDSSSMYGHEDYTMLTAGIADKFGYNIEMSDGRFIFQPSMLIAYSFINNFDYTNGAGVRINSTPTHVIQMAPGIKFIMNSESGWQPYIAVNMIWNLINDSKVTANNVVLPDMTIKPYVQYGLGVQKKIEDNFMMYSQAMAQNGGRNGVALTAGLRWAVGHN